MQLGDFYKNKFEKVGLLKKIGWTASRSRCVNLLETDFLALSFDLELNSEDSSEIPEKRLVYVHFLGSQIFTTLKSGF